MQVPVRLVGLLLLGGMFVGRFQGDNTGPAGLRRNSNANVILITIDTLRADHLGCYGDAKIQTPNIDSLAREGTRFINAYTPVPITLPAHSAILTGTFPMESGMHDFSGNRLPSSIPTLATVLGQHGYSTAAFIGAAVLDARFGLNQGFGTYAGNFDFNSNADFQTMRRSADEVVTAALAWLQHRPKRPFLVWVHLYDPHYPYTSPPPFAERYARSPYDASIAYADSQIGRLFTYLQEQHLYRGALIVLCSDHGEGLGEHGEKTHGFFVYNSTLHVPLLVKAPGVAPVAVPNAVSLVDIMPTVLDDLGFPVPETVQGKSLLPLLAGRPAGQASQVYAETYLPFLHFGWSGLQALESKGWKYISAPRPEIFDLADDPHETRNLYTSQHSRAQAMKDDLDEVLRRYSPPVAAMNRAGTATDGAVAEGLESLGYVGFSAGRLPDATDKALPDPKDRIRAYEAIVDASYASDLGHYREAIGMLREAVREDGDSPAVRYQAALDHYHLGDYSRAAEGFAKILTQQPENALAADYLGLAQAKSGNDEGAMKSFERALKLDPTNYTVAYNLGSLYLRRGRAQDAMRAFEASIHANPLYAPGYEIIGEMLLTVGENARAIPYLEKAVELDPASPKAHINLGHAYQAAGRTADAHKQFSAYPPK